MNDKADNKQARGRWQLLALALVFFGPLLVAIAMYFTGSADRGSVNYGTLLTPPATLDAKLHFDAGIRGRWTLLVVTDGNCDAACEEALVTIRQVRLATGREIDRIERAILVDDTTAMKAISQMETDLKVFANDTDIGQQMHSALSTLSDGHVYIVDPIGNVILMYDLVPDRKPMLGDLKKLLKLSRIG